MSVKYLLLNHLWDNVCSFCDRPHASGLLFQLYLMNWTVETWCGLSIILHVRDNLRWLLGTRRGKIWSSFRVFMEDWSQVYHLIWSSRRRVVNSRNIASSVLLLKLSLCLHLILLIDCMVLNCMAMRIVPLVSYLMQLLQLVPNYFLLNGWWNKWGCRLQFVLLVLD